MQMKRIRIEDLVRNLHDDEQVIYRVSTIKGSLATLRPLDPVTGAEGQAILETIYNLDTFYRKHSPGYGPR